MSLLEYCFSKSIAYMNNRNSFGHACIGHMALCRIQMKTGSYTKDIIFDYLSRKNSKSFDNKPSKCHYIPRTSIAPPSHEIYQPPEIIVKGNIPNHPHTETKQIYIYSQQIITSCTNPKYNPSGSAPLEYAYIKAKREEEN